VQRYVPEFEKEDTLGSNSVADLLQEPWGLEKLSNLSEKADTNLRTPLVGVASSTDCRVSDIGTLTSVSSSTSSCGTP
jgi:hypothetical protein